MGELMFIVLLVLAGIAISGIKIIPQSRAYVIERLGAYHRTMQTGLNFVIPFIERIANNVSLKEIVKISHHNQLLQKIMLQCKLIQLFISQLLILSYILMVLKIQ